MEKKIIVVEDDPDILFTVKMVLESGGYKVTALPSGKSIMHGHHECPELFILDKRMPDMDGLDICKYLRSKPESKSTPVIIMSASPKFGPEAMAAGATGFLAKPFAIKDLLQIVAKYIDQKTSDEVLK
jgi:CheY-like chemotaxis protein